MRLIKTALDIAEMAESRNNNCSLLFASRCSYTESELVLASEYLIKSGQSV